MTDFVVVRSKDSGLKFVVAVDNVTDAVEVLDEAAHAGLTPEGLNAPEGDQPSDKAAERSQSTGGDDPPANNAGSAGTNKKEKSS